MARTPRSAAEKLAMRKKKSRALLLFNIIAFSVVVIGAVLLVIARTKAANRVKKG